MELSLNKNNAFFYTFIIFGLFGGGCHKASTPDRVVVVGMDGLEMSMLQTMISEGQLPNFQRLFEEGYAGPLETIEPMLSPAIWTTVATGYLPDTHGVRDWINRSGRLTNSTDVKTSRIWETISRYDRSSLISGWLMTTPVTPLNGMMLSDRLVWNMSMDSRAVDESGSIPIGQSAIDGLWRHSLGSHLSGGTYPEELFAIAGNWLPSQAELEASPIAYQLRSYGLGKHPLPKDEVNLRSFERLWTDQDLAMLYLFSADQVSHLYWPFSDPSLVRLMESDRSIRTSQFAQLRATPGHENDRRIFPFVHGPLTDSQLEQAVRWVPDTYRWLDSALGRVMAKIDPTTTTLLVISDHGFKRSNQLVVIDSNHRNPGVILAWGGALERQDQDETSVPASVTQIAPTVLALLGVPVAQDMAGAPMSDLFSMNNVSSVPSWRGRTTSGEVPESDPELLLEQLRALGYLNDR